MIDPPEHPATEPDPELSGGPTDVDPPPELFDVEDADDTRPAVGAARRRLRAAVALTLVAAIVVFGAIGGTGRVRFGGGDQEPAGPPPRLAVVDANGSLATVDSTGGPAAILSAPGLTFQFPAWSPDGSRIAAIGHGGDGDSVVVLTVPAADAPDPGGAAPVIVYRSADNVPFYLYWSPDGRQVAFLTNEPPSIALRVAASDGSGAVGIVREGAPLYWDWIDNGRVIAHVGGSDPAAYLGELGTDGVAAGAGLIEPGGSVPGVFRAPAVSRDGRYRAFAATGPDAIEQIIVQARDGSTSHSLAVSGATAFSFDPGGGAVAYIAAEHATGDATVFPIGPLHVADAASGSDRVLLDGSVLAFFWSPDGKTLATLALPGPGGNGVPAEAPRTVTAMDAFAPARDAGRGQPQAGALDAGPGLGLQFGFVDVASGTARAAQAIRVTDTFSNQILPYFDQYALSHRFWSPDSASVALPLVGPDGADQLTVIPADGSASHAVANGAVGFWSP